VAFDKETQLWLSGNEAIALGAWEAGVRVASGYPGTPSTEIMGNLSRYEGVYTEWAPNGRWDWKWPSAPPLPEPGRSRP
jgi:Indolepyruvate ferredoxin oxidoreductase, alpha and beta subunits